MRVTSHRVLTGFALLMFSGSAFAGTLQPRIFFEPGGFAPVPALSQTMLIALSLLLVVMAVRFFRDNQGTVKTVAGTVILSGLLMGGYGVERTLATGELTVTGGQCTEGGEQGFAGTRLAYLDNQCGNALIVTDIQNCPSPSYVDEGHPGCRVNTVLNPNGGRCNMPRCEVDE